VPPSPVPAETFTSPWPAAAARARGRADKREAVLRTAVRLFNEKGFHATSLDEVAERLHVTKPTLYYYVESKEAILFACVEIGLEMVREGIAEAAKSGGSALDKLRACMRAYASVVTRDFGMCVIRVGEEPLPADSRRRLRALKAKIDHEFRSLIEQGIAEGVIAPCDAKLAAFTLAGGLSWIGRWYDPAGPLDADTAAERCIAVLLNGIVPRAPAAKRAPKPAARKARA
jgi:AcrR family transcriptional regulator